MNSKKNFSYFKLKFGNKCAHCSMELLIGEYAYGFSSLDQGKWKFLCESCYKREEKQEIHSENDIPKPNLVTPSPTNKKTSLLKDYFPVQKQESTHIEEKRTEESPLSPAFNNMLPTSIFSCSFYGVCVQCVNIVEPGDMVRGQLQQPREDSKSNEQWIVQCYPTCKYEGSFEEILPNVLSFDESSPESTKTILKKRKRVSFHSDVLDNEYNENKRKSLKIKKRSDDKL